MWFEQLRAVFAQDKLIGHGIDQPDRPRVRVIGFRSEKEYDAYRLRPAADAYYVGTESRDYIVMPALGSREFGTAAHEYAHLFLHASGLRLPLWLNEGLAEFFSTIRTTGSGYAVGGELPLHTETLRRYNWLSLPELLSLDRRSFALQTRKENALFYAECWALTDLLLSSREYAPHFGELIRVLNEGVPSTRALTAIYGKPLEAIAHDWKTYVYQGNFPRVALSQVGRSDFTVESSAVSEFQASALMAELLLANGDLIRAKSLYQELVREQSENPNIWGALGTIALREGNHVQTVQYWQQAIDKGVTDANLCYRYAVLADEGGLETSSIRRALERAIALEADFDDARYKLALLYSNAGEFEAALRQLRTMRSPSTARAFAYWSATAYALTELGKRDEASVAAGEAMKHAANAEDRARAAQLAYVANTDLAVQFARDAKGELLLTTTRVPHGTTDWNPFVERGDQIRRVEGSLRTVGCSGSKLTDFSVDTSDGPLTLTVPDPQHVLMRNAPSEFNCGSQPAKNVIVEYAAPDMANRNRQGVLRGMTFR